MHLVWLGAINDDILLSDCEEIFQSLEEFASDAESVYFCQETTVWDRVKRHLIVHVYDLHTVAIIEDTCPIIHDLRQLCDNRPGKHPCCPFW